tara:strand:+ start:345 stop:560 length:216 start_codon:yes stop_codon:yes gene_type:complete
MANFIENNRKTWFTLNEELKRMGNKPVEKNTKSLLQRKEKNVSDDMLSTKQYMLTIRNAFKRNMEAEEEKE